METKQQVRPVREQKPPAAYSSKGAKRLERVERQEQPKNDRDAKPVSIGAIISVLLVLIIVSLLALIYFDLLGVKDFAVSALNLEQPSNRYMAQLATKEEELLALQSTLETKESELRSLEKDLNKRENTVVSLDAELKARQDALTQMQVLVQGLQTDIDSMGQMIERMTPQKAADALSMLYHVTDVAKILVAMPAESSAKILNCMTPERAGAIFAEMLRYTS